LSSTLAHLFNLPRFERHRRHTGNLDVARTVTSVAVSRVLRNHMA